MPYHRLGRTSRYHPGWLVLGGLLIAFQMFIGGWVIVGLNLVFPAHRLGAAPATGQDALDGASFADPHLDNITALLALATLLPTVLLVVLLLERRPVGSVVSVLGRLRVRWLGACAGLALLVLVVADLIGGYLYPYPAEAAGEAAEWVGWERFLPLFGIYLAVYPLQAAGEEFVARGWLLQAVGALTRSPWPAVATSAVVFSLLHWPTGMAAFLTGVVTGGVMAWLTVRTGGLETAIAYHALGNLGVGFFEAAFGEVLGTIGEATWVDFAYSAATDALFLLVVLLVLRWRPVATRTPHSTSLRAPLLQLNLAVRHARHHAGPVGAPGGGRRTGAPPRSGRL